MIKRFSNFAVNAELIDEKSFKINECETCAFIKNHQIIFRSHRKSENENTFFTKFSKFG